MLAVDAAVHRQVLANVLWSRREAPDLPGEGRRAFAAVAAIQRRGIDVVARSQPNPRRTSQVRSSRGDLRRRR